MNYADVLQLKLGDVVSVVGSGGKTSLLFRLAEECRDKFVLISTTTKMLRPDSGQYDWDISRGASIQPGINLLYGGEVGEKITAPPLGQIRALRPADGLTLLECDGSKGKPLKGWVDDEPVIPAFSTVTIGVLGLWALGQRVDNRTVHRIERFCRLTGATPGEPVSLDHLAAIVEHPEGLFHRARGRRVLFLNVRQGEPGIAQAIVLTERLDPALCQTFTILAGDLHGDMIQVLVKK
ncbi:MAG: selenium cofactor biosynthesis protein YqeC [Oscillospiraceae bacterium]|nr:selenium cofactor biosynthesis protein YqeC [Oscillospiraceae bacterium]